MWERVNYRVAWEKREAVRREKDNAQAEADKSVLLLFEQFACVNGNCEDEILCLKGRQIYVAAAWG